MFRKNVFIWLASAAAELVLYGSPSGKVAIITLSRGFCCLVWTLQKGEGGFESYTPYWPHSLQGSLSFQQHPMPGCGHVPSYP
jgi:hypothetical protein